MNRMSMNWNGKTDKNVKKLYYNRFWKLFNEKQKN